MSDTLKQGRPSVISYEIFLETWLKLTESGKASINAVQEQLGGRKSIIANFRERYEHEKASEKMAFINNIQLPDAIRLALSEIKVSQIEALEQAKNATELRLNEIIQSLENSEAHLATAKLSLEETKLVYENKEKELCHQYAVSEALRIASEEREKSVIKRCEELLEQLNQAKQEVAVSQKEISMLRERKK